MKIRLPGFAITFGLTAASALARILSPLQVDSLRVERIRNLAYGSGPFQRLDVYLPRNRSAGKLLPVSIVIHGGGFRYFSKESHALVASRLAQSGRIVFCVDYRTAPKHPFPAGLLDVHHAYSWIVEEAKRFGGDREKISLVGESSGASFIASLCLSLFSIRGFAPGVSAPPTPAFKPRAAVLHCGVFEVENLDRFKNDPRFPPVARTRIKQIRDQYLGGSEASGRELAEPLLAYRDLKTPPHGFPEFFLPVGSLDPVIGDSERLAAELARLGQKDRLKTYPGVNHAFYIGRMTPGSPAAECWADIFAFLGRAGV